MNDLTSLNFTGGVGISNAITVTGDPDFSVATCTTSVISGAITGSGSVTINNTAGNTGTIEFTNTGNAYSGTTTVKPGATLLGGAATRSARQRDDDEFAARRSTSAASRRRSTA